MHNSKQENYYQRDPNYSIGPHSSIDRANNSKAANMSNLFSGSKGFPEGSETVTPSQIKSQSSHLPHNRVIQDSLVQSRLIQNQVPNSNAGNKLEVINSNEIKSFNGISLLKGTKESDRVNMYKQQNSHQQGSQIRPPVYGQVNGENTGRLASDSKNEETQKLGKIHNIYENSYFDTLYEQTGSAKGNQLNSMANLSQSQFQNSLVVKGLDPSPNKTRNEEQQLPNGSQIRMNKFSMHNDAGISKINDVKPEDIIEEEIDLPNEISLHQRGDSKVSGISNSNSQLYLLNQQSNEEFQESIFLKSQQYVTQLNKKESDEKYDPAMFQSVSGYFYQSESSKTIDSELYASMVENVFDGKSDEEVNEKRILQEFVRIYLKEQPRVNIQRINRQLSGLSTADNLGDFFIKRYSKNLEMLIPGCAGAQHYPVHIGVRGDGNCFYRGLMVGYLMRILTEDAFFGEVFDLLYKIAFGEHKIIDLTYQDTVKNDQENVRIILMQNLLQMYLDRRSISKLVLVNQSNNSEEKSSAVSLFLMTMIDRIAKDHDLDYALVVLSRSMIMQAIIVHSESAPYKDFFSPQDLEFTLEILQQFKEDAQMYAISLSTEAFKVPVQILSIQRNKQGMFELNDDELYKPHEYTGSKHNRTVQLLLHGEHYDLVIDSETSNKYFDSLILFKQHATYKEALEQIIQLPETKPHLRQVYERHLGDYNLFLSQQEQQITKAKRTLVRIQSMYMSRTSLLRSQSHVNEGNIQYNSKTQHEEEKQSTQMFFKQESDQHQNKLNHSHNQINFFAVGNNNDIPSSDVVGGTSEIKLQQKQFILMSNDSAIILKDDDEEEEESLVVYHARSEEQAKMNAQLFSSSFYSCGDVGILESSSRSSGGMLNAGRYLKQGVNEANENILQCDHAVDSKIVIKPIVCCKIRAEICYYCFKTKQNYVCGKCQKQYLSGERLKITTKDARPVCKTCYSSNIIPLFNKIYCQKCDLEQTYS